MASLPSSLCSLIFSISCLLLISINVQPLARSTHHKHENYDSSTGTTVTKSFSFSNFHLHSNSSLDTDDIVLLGSAGISNINGSIQIPSISSSNSNSSSQAGRAIFAYPIHLFDPTSSQTSISFSTTFSFQIQTTNTNDGTLPTESQKSGGLAFIIVVDEFTVGRPGPWLGMVNDACERHKMFGVEFDTNYDPDFGDPSDDHIGINLGTIASIKTVDLSQSTRSMSLHDNTIHRAWIQYNSGNKWIDIFLGHEGDAMPTQAILSSPLYLNKDILNEYMFVGFSASTDEFSTHTYNILSWNFSSSFKSFIESPPLSSENTCYKNVLHQVSKYANITKGDRNFSPSSFEIFVSIMGLLSFALAVLYCSSNNKEVILGDNIILPDINQRPMSLGNARAYTIHEVHRVTRGFSEENVLGSDSIGTFYKGTLPNGSYVSMKRIVDFNISRASTLCAIKRINTLVQVCHEGLAPIRGWCFNYNEMIVVYDYFQNGSLENWLYGIGVLPWSCRVKIVHNIAESLLHLHSNRVIHGNLEMSSIFLDVKCHAVLSHYDLQKVKLSKDDMLLNGMRSDVVAFGMIVIEILVGKKIVKLEGEEGKEIGATELAWIMHERGEDVKVIDEKMMSSCCVEREQTLHILKVGMICTLAESNGSPSMEEVMKYLDKKKPIPKFPPKRPI